MAEVFRWTGHFPERTPRLLRHLAGRAGELGQVYPADGETRAVLALSALVTALAMNHVHHGAYTSGEGEAAAVGPAGATPFVAPRPDDSLARHFARPPLDRQLRDAVHERRVVDARRLRPRGELARLPEVAVGVHLDDVDVLRLGQAEIDAGVVADEQGAARPQRDLVHPRLELLRDVGQDGLGPLELGAASSHLAL